MSVLSGYNVFVDADACCIGQDVTSHHITSHHITSHHITSHHITSHHVTAAMANAAFFSHFPLKERYVSNPLPLQSTLEAAGYLSPTGEACWTCYSG